MNTGNESIGNRKHASALRKESFKANVGVRRRVWNLENRIKIIEEERMHYLDEIEKWKE